MVMYRRNFVAGGTYFFTATLQNRKSSLLTTRIDDLREAVRPVLREKPFRIDAWVTLPEHIHAIWTLPPGDADYSGRWRSLKARFSRRLALAGLPVAKNRRGEYDVWQSRFWEHTVRDETDFVHHVDYIQYNPVKHGWAKQVRDWPYSSFHRYVAQGVYPPDWGASVDDICPDCGESDDE